MRVYHVKYADLRKRVVDDDEKARESENCPVHATTFALHESTDFSSSSLLAASCTYACAPAEQGF